MILFLWPHRSCPNDLVTSNMAPAHPHATSVAVYPALFQCVCVYLTSQKIFSCQGPGSFLSNSFFTSFFYFLPFFLFSIFGVLPFSQFIPLKEPFVSTFMTAWFSQSRFFSPFFFFFTPFFANCQNLMNTESHNSGDRGLNSVRNRVVVDGKFRHQSFVTIMLSFVTFVTGLFFSIMLHHWLSSPLIYAYLFLKEPSL